MIYHGETKFFSYYVDDCFPYIYIKVKPALGVSELKIISLSDAHIGARGFYEKKFLEYLKFIQSQPVLWYCAGDLFEMTIAGSRVSVFEQDLFPQEQLEYFYNKIKEAKIEDKMIFSQVGNHELRLINESSIDPMYWVQKSLGVADRHFRSPVYLTVEFGKGKFNFYSWHGSSSAQTVGGKINAASKPSGWITNAHYFLMGHVHSSEVAPVVHQKLQLQNGRLVYKEFTQYIIISPAFYKYYKTYGATAGYRPPSTGAVVPYLYKNGTYGTSS